jgi:hypothetical protein
MNPIKIRFKNDLVFHSNEYGKYKSIARINNIIENTFKEKHDVHNYLDEVIIRLDRAHPQLNSLLMDEFNSREFNIENIDFKIESLLDRTFDLNYTYELKVTTTTVLYNCIDIKYHHADLPVDIYVCYEDGIEDAEVKFLKPAGRVVVIK